MITRPLRRPLSATLAALLLAGCALPELDGRPVKAFRADDFIPASGAPQAVIAPGQVWGLTFGDAGLARMLAEADAGGLDVATARARFKAADLTMAQARHDASGLTPSANAGLDGERPRVDASLAVEPDLSGRLSAGLALAQIEHQVSGVDLWVARRLLAREVVQGWIALAEARSTAARLAGDIAADERVLALTGARAKAGEVTTADVTTRRQALVRAQAQAASSATRVALAEARLRALGVRTIPASISLKGARRPPVLAQTDLGATDGVPAVCTAWLRLRASDASRAQAVAATRPRLVATTSLAATARTLAGLASGNPLAVTNSIRLEGTLVDGGAARRQVDQARVGVAQAEIDWRRARAQAEIAALEAVAAQQSAEAALSAALRAWDDARADRARVAARHDAGMADGLEIAEAERALNSAQREVDTARAEALRAAAQAHETLPVPLAACAPRLAQEAAL